jgi:hypothetical protein
MIKVCSWCNKNLGAVPGTTGNNHEYVTSHGICHKCANKIFQKLGIELKIFLHSLDAPVVLVNGSGNVETANRKAQDLFKKNLSDIEGFKGGEIFECAYSELPEGCGKTIHCSGCTIRNAVMDTYKFGKSHKKTPAYLNTGDPQNPKKIDLLISTEKAGVFVLLRIDKFTGKEETQPITELDELTLTDGLASYSQVSPNVKTPCKK